MSSLGSTSGQTTNSRIVPTFARPIRWNSSTVGLLIGSTPQKLFGTCARADGAVSRASRIAIAASVIARDTRPRDPALAEIELCSAIGTRRKTNRTCRTVHPIGCGPLHVSAGHENDAAEDREWRRTLAALEAGEPVVRCEQPQLDPDAATAVQGDIRFAGWAVSKAGIDSVAVDVEAHGALRPRSGGDAPTSTRPSIRLGGAAAAASSSRSPPPAGFPAATEVTVSARGADGASSSLSGRIEWLPDHGQLAGELPPVPRRCGSASRATTRSSRSAAAVSVRGWVERPRRARGGERRPRRHRAGAGIRRRSRLRARRRDAESAVRARARRIRARPGPRALTVEALARDGAASRRSGEIVIDPDARYRLRLAKRRNAEQRSADPVSSLGAAELRLCVTGGAPREALRGSLDAQLRAPALVTGVEHGLDAELRSLLDSDHLAAVFVDCEDALLPWAVDRVAARFEAASPPDVVYSDHDAIDARGRVGDPFLKPGWSPELLLSLPYVGSFVAVGRGAAEAALRLAADDLRERPGATAGAHRRAAAGRAHPAGPVEPTAASMARGLRGSGFTRCYELGRRRGARLSVRRRDPHAGVREVAWELDEHPLVSVVIPTAAADGTLAACLRALRERTAYPRLEVVLVDSGGTAPEVAARALDGVEHRVIGYDAGGQFNFSRACNLGAEAARGEYLLFLNDDTEALDEAWLERLVAQARLPSAGVVGAKLLYPGGLVQHAGLVIDRLPKPPGVDFVAAQFAFHQDSSGGPHGLLEVRATAPP